MSTEEERDTPAFPFEYDQGNGYGGTYRQTHPGMYKREYFAAQIMASILSDPNASMKQKDLNHFAKASYSAADALLDPENRKGLSSNDYE